MKYVLPLSTILLCVAGCQKTNESGSPITEVKYSKTSSTQVLQETDLVWSRWRGPNGNGIAANGQAPVNEWDSETNVIWKTKVPGRGHASPIIAGDRIFLATSDSEAQFVLCYGVDDGDLLWSTQVNKGGLRKIHRNNSHASSTISSDENKLFVVMENHDKVNLYVLDHDGKLLWEKAAGAYNPQFPFGFGASPLIHGDNVYVAGESKNGFLVAYDRESGDEVWRIERPATSFSSPIVTTIDGKEMLLISGGGKVHAYAPQTGEQIWEAAAKWQVSCGTMVWDGNLVFASGGFPAQQTIAINANNGEVVWQNGVKCYEQSLLAYDGYVYGVNDRAVAYCWRAKDGEEMWTERLPISGGGVSASPVLANGNIYASVEAGTTFVFKANPEKFELVAKNQLGDSAFATPTIADSRIYLRIGDNKQEWLYCIGE